MKKLIVISIKNISLDDKLKKHIKAEVRRPDSCL